MRQFGSLHLYSRDVPYYQGNEFASLSALELPEIEKVVMFDVFDTWVEIRNEIPLP